jgi:hypothetical protein
MESWFADAKQIDSLDADIGFLLQDNFYYGPDCEPEVSERTQVESLPSQKVSRHSSSMVLSTEAHGQETALADYYSEVLRLAKKHGKSFNEIRHYFWIRLRLTNTEEKIRIPFPWYDTFSEIDRFFSSLSGHSDGPVFCDADQGWEFEVHASEGDFVTRLRNPDNEKILAIVRLPMHSLRSSIEPLRTQAIAIIKTLSSQVGRDLWTNPVDWPEF